MIELVRAQNSFDVPNGEKTVLEDVSTVFPKGQCIALLGRNGAGKSTLLKMIAGTLDLDDGEIRISGTVSWPIGFAGSFHPDLTAAQNTRFVARVYGVATDGLSDFVQDFAELGSFFHMPVRTLSAGMKARLAFGVSMGVPFDCYLIDEVTAVGDMAFREKCKAYLLDRLKRAGAIVVSHSLPLLLEICDAAMVLEHGQLHYYDDINAAMAAHRQNLAA